MMNNFTNEKKNTNLLKSQLKLPDWFDFVFNPHKVDFKFFG